jgi:hypothetical protein
MNSRLADNGDDAARSCVTLGLGEQEVAGSNPDALIAALPQ